VADQLRRAVLAPAVDEHVLAETAHLLSPLQERVEEVLGYLGVPIDGAGRNRLLLLLFPERELVSVRGRAALARRRRVRLDRPGRRGLVLLRDRRPRPRCLRSRLAPKRQHEALLRRRAASGLLKARGRPVPVAGGGGPLLPRLGARRRHRPLASVSTEVHQKRPGLAVVDHRVAGTPLAGLLRGGPLVLGARSEGVVDPGHRGELPRLRERRLRGREALLRHRPPPQRARHLREGRAAVGLFRHGPPRGYRSLMLLVLAVLTSLRGVMPLLRLRLREHGHFFVASHLKRQQVRALLELWWRRDIHDRGQINLLLNNGVSEATAIIAASMNSLLPRLPDPGIILRSLIRALLLHDHEDGRLLRVVSVWQWLGIG
jgi:hypothetical protein